MWPLALNRGPRPNPTPPYPKPHHRIWIERVLILNPQSTQWVNSYAQSNLKYLKDLRTAYYAVTQLGQVFTGGKYEKLLGDKKRKTLANIED